MSQAAAASGTVAELVAYEEKLVGELPYRLARERIARVTPRYTARLGEEAARLIHGAMVAKLRTKRGARS